MGISKVGLSPDSVPVCADKLDRHLTHTDHSWRRRVRLVSSELCSLCEMERRRALGPASFLVFRSLPQLAGSCPSPFSAAESPPRPMIPSAAAAELDAISLSHLPLPPLALARAADRVLGPPGRPANGRVGGRSLSRMLPPIRGAGLICTGLLEFNRCRVLRVRRGGGAAQAT